MKWDDLVDPHPPFENLPYLDTAAPDLSLLSENQRRWSNEGVVHLERIIPEDLIQNYMRVRDQVKNLSGWETTTPYMQHKELRDLGLYKPLIEEMEMLIGDRMGMHLNLTGYVSTERGWHQDEYLNPPYINSWYCAAWFALEDIKQEQGPFQYVPGSHKWGIMRMEKTMSFLKPEENNANWPRTAERFVNEACEEEIKKREAPVETYLPSKGDVLLWHPRLLHRGSKPKRPGIQRKAFIAHYSALSVRSDMINRSQHDNGNFYFTFNHPDQVGK